MIEFDEDFGEKLLAEKVHVLVFLDCLCHLYESFFEYTWFQQSQVFFEEAIFSLSSKFSGSLSVLVSGQIQIL